MTHVGTWAVENTLDGFDRVIQVEDAIGGVMLFTHDPDGRVVTTVQQGQPKGASPTDRTGSGNVDLASSSSCFDEAGRAYESQQNVFINSGWGSGHGVPSGHSVTHTGGGLAANSTANDHTLTVTLTDGESSYALTRNVFDRSGRMIALAMDNGAVAQYEFDGIGRQIKATDPLGNIVETSYDAAGNVIHAPPGTARYRHSPQRHRRRRSL